MALTVTFSNHYKYQNLTKAINLASDTLKCLLVKSGFVFDPDTYATKTNLKATSGSITATFSSSAGTITRPTGSFITDGFVVGNQIDTTSGNNAGPFTITTVAALSLTVTGSMADETAVPVTITADDELETGFGYTQDGETVAGAAVAEDDTDDRSEFTCTNPSWTAAAGSIGPTPGMIIYDDTSSDDTIVCYCGFGADVTVPDGALLTIVSLELRSA